MIGLNGAIIPEHFNGVMIHDTSNAWWPMPSYEEGRAIARDFREHGVTGFMLLESGGSKLNFARALVDEGHVVMVRTWQEEPWRLAGALIPPGDQLRPYVDVGAQLNLMGLNEFNIDWEWLKHNIPINPAVIARIVVDAWEVCLERAVEVPGLIPLFPSNTPGGNVNHRWCYQEIAAELQNRGLGRTVKHAAIHNRPLNNPPDAVWTPENTCTFNEWEWVDAQFRAIGAKPFWWATEHGYALKDWQNKSYPQITLALWEQYNRELQLRMNPAHPKAIGPEFAGHCHWLWQCQGTWTRDGLVGSIDPDMPDPSPLWVWMGQTDELNFRRYDGEFDIARAVALLEEAEAALATAKGVLNA
jgi:hypothetical protein